MRRRPLPDTAPGTMDACHTRVPLAVVLSLASLLAMRRVLTTGKVGAVAVAVKAPLVACA